VTDTRVEHQEKGARERESKVAKNADDELDTNRTIAGYLRAEKQEEQ
jgi:hypothetical protein